MKIDIEVTEDDYIKFNEFHQFNSTLGKQSIRIYKTYFLITILLITLCILFYFPSIPFLLFGILVDILGIYISFKNLIPRNVRKRICKNVNEMKKEGKLPYTTNAEIEFTDDEIIQKSDVGMLKIKYTDIVKTIDIDEYFYIYYGAIQAFIVPKRCITNKESEIKKFLFNKTAYNDLTENV